MKKLNEADLRGIGDKPECPIDVFCKGLEYAGETHKSGYFHYTKRSSFENMARLVQTSDGEQHHVVVTKAPYDKNDLSEGSLDRRYWYVSFTYLPHELVLMWVMYGKYKSDAVRLRFSPQAVKEWAKKPFNNIKVYQVPADGQPNVYKRINVDVADVKLVDIGYFAKRDKVIDKREGVLHRHRKYTVRIPENGIVGLKGTPDEKYMPYLKDAIWADEREVRLLLTFSKPVECDKIAISFDGPITDLLKDTQRNVILSPWLKVTDGALEYSTSACAGKIADK